MSLQVYLGRSKTRRRAASQVVAEAIKACYNWLRGWPPILAGDHMEDPDAERTARPKAPRRYGGSSGHGRADRDERNRGKSSAFQESQFGTRGREGARTKSLERTKIGNREESCFGPVGKIMAVDKSKIQEEVDRNYEEFQKLLPSLLAEHRDKFALMKDGKVLGYYSTAQDAAQAAQTFIKDGIFSIQEVTDNAINLGFLTYAVPVNTLQS